MDNEKQAFLDRLDTFAEGLSSGDQQLLLTLLGGDEEVAGFGFEPPWPGVRNVLSPDMLAGIKLGDIKGEFLSSGHTTGQANPIAGGDLGSGR